jgi:hypothetical protein
MKHDPDFMEKITSDLEARKAAGRILDISESADMNELKKAYRKAAAKYHPDHNSNTPEANRRFILIKCAYELLAFDKPCEEIVEEINSWPGVPDDGKYKLANPWGHFLWWREKFFALESNKKKNRNRKNSCI